MRPCPMDLSLIGTGTLDCKRDRLSSYDDTGYVSLLKKAERLAKLCLQRIGAERLARY